VAELIGVATCFAFVFGAFYVFFKVQDKLMGIRVSPETEMEGLDLPEMGAFAYPEFTLSGK
jgi:Amt family ammonium transporter